MSLHNLAQHLQSAGRGDDKILVHMTPKEVGGLQSLAMAHGGSLSINPDTGLPEAGILSKLLPTVLGFALGPAGMGVTIGGLSSAASAGLISGAIGTLATGSLSKGISAGLGAYGGASLSGALMNAGTAAQGASQAFPVNPALTQGPAPSLANAVTSTPDVITKMNQGVLNSPMLNPAAPGVQGATGLGSVAPVPTPDIQRIQVSAPPVQNILPDTYYQQPRPQIAPPPKVEDAVSQVASQPAKEPLSFDTSTFGGRMSAVNRGVKDIFSNKDKLWEFAKENPMAIASVAMPLLEQDYKLPSSKKAEPLEKYRYVYDRNPIGVAASRSSERNYFPNARYEPTGEYYAGGGLAALANGGPVEDMSRMNVVGANTGYPMANQMSSTYATPAERPISENIIHPQGDANVDPYTGEQKFADGGYTRYTGDDFYGEYDPKKDDYYYMPGTSAGSGYFMVRDSEQGGAGSAGKSGSSAGFFDPSYYNPKTGQYGTPAAPKAPTLGTKAVQQTRETLNPMYQKYFGRDIDEAGLATYTAKPFSEANLDTIFKGAPEYQTAEPLRAAKAQELAAKEREANLASAEQAADIYERVMGRAPDLAGLEYYAKTNRMTPEEMEKSLRGSDEYFKNLAKPFNPPITYGDNGRASIEGAPKYDPSQYGFAMGGGVSDLGGYSDGGRLLKGPGDGVSDSIPAVIGKRQPARLADGEFVIPARIVSELGNGSTEAGARKLYAMMDRIQNARKKSVGKGKVAANTKSEKYLPA
jgi:hypothetical protein